MLSQFLKNSVQIPLVAGKIRAKDENVVKIDDNGRVQQVKEDRVHHPLKSTRRILEAKSHNFKLVGSVSARKCSLMLVGVGNGKLVVSVAKVQSGEVACST